MASTVTRLTNDQPDLFSLTDDEFRAIVDREVRRDHPNTSPEERATLARVAEELRKPDILERWHAALLIMKKSGESQLGARKSDLKKRYGNWSDKWTPEEYEKACRAFHSWRAGNIRFLNGVEERLIECRRLLREEFGGKLPEILEILRERIALVAVTYEQAIIDHKRRTLADDLEPSPADEQLWELLGNDRT